MNSGKHQAVSLGQSRAKPDEICRERVTTIERVTNRVEYAQASGSARIPRRTRYAWRIIMNYFRAYQRLIRRAKTRAMEGIEYTEKHHIFPISIFGKNNKTVKLTFREHYIAHLLLMKNGLIHPNSNVTRALVARGIPLSKYYKETDYSINWFRKAENRNKFRGL